MKTTLILLLLIGTLGAIDTFYYHEIKLGLARQITARKELLLHTSRDFAYCILFGTLAWFEFHGLYFYFIAFVLTLEIIITLYDFIEEDITRRLPAGERVLHTLIAILYGAFLAYLLPDLKLWFSLPTETSKVSYGFVSIILTCFSIGVLVSGIRDLLAAYKLKNQKRTWLV